MEDIHRGTIITELSLEKLKEMLPDEKDCTVGQLRIMKGTANLHSSQLSKTDQKLRDYQTIKLYLEKAERERSIDEQFPYVRTDMDEFDKQLNKLFTSRAFVEYRLNYESDQMELAVRQLFRAHLKKGEWDFWDVPLSEGKLYKKKDVLLVHWDTMIGARNGDECRLFLLETKLYPHANDVLCDENDIKRYNKCLYVRGKRTIVYLASLSDKNIKEQCGTMRTQDTALIEFVDAKVELVYASRIMNQEIKTRIEQVSTLLSADGYSANVSFMECPTVSEGNFTSVLSDDNLSIDVLGLQQSEQDDADVHEKG